MKYIKALVARSLGYADDKFFLRKINTVQRAKAI